MFWWSPGFELGPPVMTGAINAELGTQGAILQVVLPALPIAGRKKKTLAGLSKHSVLAGY